MNPAHVVYSWIDADVRDLEATATVLELLRESAAPEAARDDPVTTAGAAAHGRAASSVPRVLVAALHTCDQLNVLRSQAIALCQAANQIRREAQAQRALSRSATFGLPELPGAAGADPR